MLERKGFSAIDFQQLHPATARPTPHVKDIMHAVRHAIVPLGTDMAMRSWS